MSFFKPPSWGKPQATDDEETEQDIFSHSNKFMAVTKDRLEQEKRREERKAQKQKEREDERDQKKRIKLRRRERKASGKRESTDGEASGGLKKRRINSEEAANLLASVGRPKSTSIDSDDEDVAAHAESTPSRRSPRVKGTKDALKSPRTKSHLRSTLDINGNSDDEIQITAATSKSHPAPQPQEDEDSDPEIAALKRQARETKKAKLQQGQKSSTPGAKNPDGAIGSERRDTSVLSTPPPADHIISLFITSDIPDAKPLLIKRKLSQTLEEVLNAWCSKQSFSKAFADKVFLTFDGRRLWGFNTCQRLGLEVDSRGEIIRADARDKDGAAQVHLIVMTEELLEECKADKARHAKAEIAMDDEEREDEASEPEVDEAPPARKEIRLAVKAKGLSDHKVKLYSTTLLAKVITSARNFYKIPSDQPVYLQFDGERLDPDDALGDTELEDMDGIDLLMGD